MIEIRTLDEMRAGRTVIQITVGSEPGADLPPQEAVYRAAMDAEEEASQLRNDLARVTGELVEAQRLLAVARMAEDSRLKDRDNRIGELEADLATARASEVAAERLKERNSKIESLETKLGLAHADRANLKREVTRLEGELDAASRLAQSADTRRATAELRAEQAAADLETAIEQRDRIAAALDAATGHLLLRDGELASANDQRDAERSRADQNKAWAERAESHLARTRAELATANDNFVTSQNRVKELEEANASLVAEARQHQADPGTRLYTAAEVESAQTSETESVTAVLNMRIQAQESQIGSVRDIMTKLAVTTALGQVTPGTPGDVLARAVRLARMTLAIKH